MKQIQILIGFVLCLLAGHTLTATAQEQARLQFDLKQRQAPVSPDLFGIFFEEINHGGEGGLYGEAIVNRSFDDDYGSFYGWSWQNADCSLTKTNLLNSAQRNACRTTFNSSASWLRNSGFGGINIVRGENYRVSLWVRADGNDFSGSITVRLVDPASGSSFGVLRINGPFTSQWRKCEGVIRPTTSFPGGALQIQASAATTLVFDMVSLFPPTFKDRENGMRRDLAQMLADLHPSFMRFPGGCYVEGRTGWAPDPNNNTRWEWKKTIGPIEERPGHRNQQWGYWVSDGQGYHEFLQFCEDIGAAAMFVCNVGMGHGWCQDYRNIGEFIQETLDAIEYANGDSTTVWGRRRAQNGHPEPFNLKYVEIGNENCNFNFGNNSDQSDHYFERYIQFYNAIKTHFPDVITIANVEAWATDFPSWRSNYPVELVDEHYYRDNNFYINNYEKYNSYARSGAGIYIGEYAANIGSGIGNLGNALAEAIYMQGLENNADIVKMASFAPIFMNETYGGWNYDIIRFNHSGSYGIPSYYVQQMFGQNQGHYILHWNEYNNVPQLSSGSRHIGVGTWLTSATFSDINVTDVNGNTLFSQANSTSTVWTRGTGTWAYTSSGIRQTNQSAEGATYICTSDLPNQDYNYTLRATKTAGSEGFLILFNYKDSNNYTWWNLGGWGNTAYGLENCISGVRSTIARTDGSLEDGHTYDIRIEKRGSRVKCYLDETLVHDVEIPAGYAKGVYTSASLCADRTEAIIKLTNPNPSELPLAITFNGGVPTGLSAQILTAPSLTAENNMGNRQAVVPRATSDAAVVDTTVQYDVPAYSFTVLHVQLADVAEPATPAPLPAPTVSYSFERLKAESDDGVYTGQLMGGASIIELSDGNHVVYTGNIGSRGFVNLGTHMAENTFKSVSDYTITLDLLNRSDNNMGSFAWAMALSDGTNSYFGFINAAGGRNWYAELKDNGGTEGFASGAAMRSSEWHNLSFVCHDGKGTFYIDGRPYASRDVSVKLSDFVSRLNGCYLGRSPFTADAYMENAYFDNFNIYTQALSADQISYVWERTQSMSNDENERMNMPLQLSQLIGEARSVSKYADDSDLSAAIAEAQKLSVTMPAQISVAMNRLNTAMEQYAGKQYSLLSQGKQANLSFMLRNGLFTLNDGLYWAGTEFTAIDHETAEQFSRTFDNYQVVTLPAGIYQFEADAFYRAGSIDVAYSQWKSASYMTSPAELYAGSGNIAGGSPVTVPVKSLYASTSYTYSPYTYPDNLAAASTALNASVDAYHHVLTFTLTSESEVRLGIRKLTAIDADWTAFDNFRLYYMGVPTAIADLQHDSNDTQTSIYDITGRRLNAHPATPGLYITGGNKVFIRR